MQHQACTAAERHASLQFNLLCAAGWNGPLQHHPCSAMQVDIRHCSIKLSPAANAHASLQPHACSAWDAHLLLCLLQALCLAHALRVELHILLHACSAGNKQRGMKRLGPCTKGQPSLHLGSGLTNSCTALCSDTLECCSCSFPHAAQAKVLQGLPDQQGSYLECLQTSKLPKHKLLSVLRHDSSVCQDCLHYECCTNLTLTGSARICRPPKREARLRQAHPGLSRCV